MRKAAAFGITALVSNMALLAQTDIPLRNWTVPPFTVSSSGGIRTMTDATDPRAFIGLAVCRLLDTRTGTLYPLDGDGKYAVDEIRTYTVPPACGVPAGSDAVSLNVTVTDTDANPFGHIKIWPANQAEPTVSTLNWSSGGQTVANAAIVALSGTGSLSVNRETPDLTSSWTSTATFPTSPPRREPSSSARTTRRPPSEGSTPRRQTAPPESSAGRPRPPATSSASAA